LFAGENLEYIDNGYIVIKNGRIEKVGTGKYTGKSNMNTFEGRGILILEILLVKILALIQRLSQEFIQFMVSRTKS
jgi:hypothetical protein